MIKCCFHYFIPFIFISILLCACNKVQVNHSPLPKSKRSVFEQAIPLSTSKDRFQKIIGWIDNHTIVYLVEEDRHSVIYRYNLINGVRKKWFTSNSPIKNIVISPDKKKLLVHSAPLTNLAKIQVMELNGHILYTKEIPSYDLNFNWNKQDSNQILATVFFEDWSYQIYMLNLSDQSIQKYTFSDPFVKWFNKDQIFLQDWGKSNRQLFAPLEVSTISNTSKSKTILNNVYQFDTFAHSFMTIMIPNSDKSVYHFYNDSMKESYSFTVPHVSQSNSWLVPYYDFVENTFITFVPNNPGLIDESHGKFKLVIYNIHSKNKKVIMDHLENKPVLLSPDGKLCLLGNQLNVLVDLEKGNMKSIVQYEKKSP